LRKGSYFFVLDVLLAGAIILTTLIIIQQSHVNTPITRPTQSATNDFLTQLKTTAVRDSQIEHIQKLVINNNITNIQNTLYQEAIRIHYENPEIETAYYANMTEYILPRNIGIMILVNNSIVYNRSMEFMNASTSLSATRNFAYYRKNITAIYGPIIIEVRTWQ